MVVSKNVWVPPLFVFFCLQLILNNPKNEGERVGINIKFITHLRLAEDKSHRFREIFVKIHSNNKPNKSVSTSLPQVFYLTCALNTRNSINSSLELEAYKLNN